MMLENCVGDVGVKLTEHVSTTNMMYPDQRSAHKMLRIVVTDPYATDSDDEMGTGGFVRRVKRHVVEINFCPPQKEEIQVQESEKKSLVSSGGDDVRIVLAEEGNRRFVLKIKRRVEEKELGIPKQKEEEILFGPIQEKEVEVEETKKKCRGVCKRPSGGRRFVWRNRRLEEVNIERSQPKQQEIEGRESKKFRGLRRRPSVRVQARMSARFRRGGYDRDDLSEGALQETNKEKGLVSSLEDDFCRRKKFRGVHQTLSGRWSARIRDSARRKLLYMGTYDTPREAACIFDRAAVMLRGADAVTNFCPMDVCVERGETKCDREKVCKYPRPNPGDGITSWKNLRGVRQQPSWRWGRKKFRGVRQRPSGRWGAEIPNLTQRRNVYLGTRGRLLPIKKRHVPEINFGAPQPQQQELEVQETNKKSLVILFGDKVSKDLDPTDSSDDKEGSWRLLPIKKRHVEEINFGTKQQQETEVLETKKKKKSLVRSLEDDVSCRKKFRGVSQLASGRWSARISEPSRRRVVYLGACDTREEAASVMCLS